MKAEFGTVVMSLCDRSRDWRWMLRNTPASKVVILFDANCTLFRVFMFLNMSLRRLTMRLFAKFILSNFWFLSKLPASTSTMMFESSLTSVSW